MAAPTCADRRALRYPGQGAAAFFRAAVPDNMVEEPKEVADARTC